MSQTSINKAGQPVAFAGLSADNGPSDSLSAQNLEASAGMLFGTAVKTDGSTVGGVLNMAGSGDEIKGVVMWGAQHFPGSTGDLDPTTGLKPKASFSIKRKGRIWVQLDAGLTITIGDRGFVRYSANGGNTTLGAFANANDSGHTTDVTAQVQFLSPAVTAPDGTLIALADVDFTNKP